MERSYYDYSTLPIPKLLLASFRLDALDMLTTIGDSVVVEGATVECLG
jgi:hypothetical protein